jgi:hypothetical protein
VKPTHTTTYHFKRNRVFPLYGSLTFGALFFSCLDIFFYTQRVVRMPMSFIALIAVVPLLAFAALGIVMWVHTPITVSEENISRSGFGIHRSINWENVTSIDREHFFYQPSMTFRLRFWVRSPRVTIMFDDFINNLDSLLLFLNDRAVQYADRRKETSKVPIATLVELIQGGKGLEGTRTALPRL